MSLKVLPKSSKPAPVSPALESLQKQYIKARKKGDTEEALKLDKVMTAVEEDEKLPPRTSDMLDKLERPKKKKKSVLDILDMLSEEE